MSPRRDAWRDCAAEVLAPTAAEMAALDRFTVERGLMAERTLIELAGRELARRLAERWPEGPVCGLVGSGHNGADTMVALRTLAAWGRPVRAVGCGARPPEPDVTAGWPVTLESPDEFAAGVPTAGVLIDGLLGTGASGAPREPQAALIEIANSLGLPIVAADLPSGADPTTGAVPGVCIHADLTVCFGWPKLGLLRHPASGYAGRIEAVEIGFPPSDFAELPRPAARVITARWVQGLLRPREPAGHKGTSGYLLLAAGSRGMGGAAVLAARAAYRAGVGIVRVLGAPENREIVQRTVPGAIYVSWPDPSDAAGSNAGGSDAGGVDEHVAWAHALAIGPGLGRSAERRSLVETLLGERRERPVVIDADGLNLYAPDPGSLADRLTPADVITPHPGELERLLGRPMGDDPSRDAREAAARFGCVVLLKGDPTVVASPGGSLRVSVTGGPALAVGGTGDVLTGAVGAALAAGYPAADAATVALLLTGLAARQSGFGDIGMVAEDIPEAIPGVRAAVEALGPMAPGAVCFALRAGAEPVEREG